MFASDKLGMLVGAYQRGLLICGGNGVMTIDPLEGVQMLEPESHALIREVIARCIEIDQGVLDALREEIRPLKGYTRKIQPRVTTSISLVGTDGGNNQLHFDPFLIQLIRVVDSSNNEYCLDAVSPTTPIDRLYRLQFNTDGSPCTPLGEMLVSLGVSSLPELSHMIRSGTEGRPVSPSWVYVYRELVEWAVLLSLLRRDFGTDTLVVRDGLLRSKVFAKDLFQRLLKEMIRLIKAQSERTRRKIWLVGVAKQSKVLSRYQLAMALEGVLQTNYPAYVEVPRDVENRAYVWAEFARGDDVAEEGGEINKFVGGKMFLVKFGAHRRDPIWPVDVFVPQVPEAQMILGSMLTDAINGFPVPNYPRCLQKAHENAALVDFESDILQDYVYEGLRRSLGTQAATLDMFQLQDANPAQQRYG
jgi:hypothetical protein